MAERETEISDSNEGDHTPKSVLDDGEEIRRKIRFLPRAGIGKEGY